ncbi:mechanosensitive ion channel family protein [Zwartia sp.]|uniref:mechanosensitive ion channel family protein n=1 Tax=Zwartia sp. TaxID=2978004 RepID=UPI0027252D4D|nr:mechanosensitive ion channel family protein [Zwartia sp.]MDO9024181.1 mechanosensitive ion channel family protein [Zwartia sp.]
MFKLTLKEFFTSNFGSTVPIWATATLSLLNVVVILGLAWLFRRLVMRSIRALQNRLANASQDDEEKKRVETLGRVFGYITSVTIIVVAIMLVLSEIGVSIAPLLATAGVAGIAIGFGAQSVVKDYFTGIVMLLENQIRQGDIVEVAGKAGFVEEVTLRYVRLRDYQGSVHFVPNGVITTVTNLSRNFAFAVIDIGVSYRTNIEQVFALMREVSTELREDPDFGQRILDDIEIAGVEQWADSAVMIKARIKVIALWHGPIRREYLRRLKLAFDANNIEIPFPQRVVHTTGDKANEK